MRNPPKSFFRHFPDKREVLFGGGTMAGLGAKGIAAAQAAAGPLEARQAVIAANPELREREALKGLGLIASMTDALERRGVPDLTACVAAELGARSATCGQPVRCADHRSEPFGPLDATNKA